MIHTRGPPALVSFRGSADCSTEAMTRLPYAIGEVRGSDAAGVYEVERRCFPDPYPPALLEDLMRTQRNRFFVASNAGEVVGYAVATTTGRDGHIVSVAVDPDHRRQGIGTRLLSATIRRLIEDGVGQIHLEVRKSNGTAIAFYERMGFRIRSEIKRYYSDGEDAWVLVRSTERAPTTVDEGG